MLCSYGLHYSQLSRTNEFIAVSGKFWLYATVPLALPSCLLHARSFIASPVPSHAGLLCATPTLLYDCFKLLLWQLYICLSSPGCPMHTSQNMSVRGGILQFIRPSVITTVCLPLVFRPVGWTLGLMNWRMPSCRHIIPLFRNYLVNHAHMILTSWVQMCMTVCRVIPHLVLAQSSYQRTTVQEPVQRGPTSTKRLLFTVL